MPRASTTSAPDLVRLYLLGAFRIERAARAIQLSTRKIEALLAYLALYPGAHSREKLAALFWGDSSDSDAHTSLRNAFAMLRKKIGADILIADRELAQINPHFPLWVDARQVEQIAEQTAPALNDLETALELGAAEGWLATRGDLLAPADRAEWERLRDALSAPFS